MSSFAARTLHRHWGSTGAEALFCTDSSLPPPLIWDLAGSRQPTGLTEQSYQLGPSTAQISSVINGSFQCPSPVTGEALPNGNPPGGAFQLGPVVLSEGSQWGDWRSPCRWMLGDVFPNWAGGGGEVPGWLAKQLCENREAVNIMGEKL